MCLGIPEQQIQHQKRWITGGLPYAYIHTSLLDAANAHARTCICMHPCEHKIFPCAAVNLRSALVSRRGESGISPGRFSAVLRPVVLRHDATGCVSLVNLTEEGSNPAGTEVWHHGQILKKRKSLGFTCWCASCNGISGNGLLVAQARHSADLIAEACAQQDQWHRQVLSRSAVVVVWL